MISVPQAYRFYFILNLLFYSLILFLGCSTDSSSEEDLLSFTISLSVEGQGTVAPESDSYDRNALILFEATPAPGYYFDRWIGFRETVESAQYERVVTHDLILTARFLPLPEVTDEVIQYDPKKLDPHPVFMIENGGTTAYLTAKTGESLKILLKKKGKLS